MTDDDEPQLLILGPRRRGGRPRAAVPKSVVSAWVPTAQHDRLAAIARRHDVSISTVIGRAIDRALNDPFRRRFPS